MTNHTTKIVISTNLIICSGLKLNANDLFYYLFVSSICHRPPLLTPLIQVHPPPPFADVPASLFLSSSANYCRHSLPLSIISHFPRLLHRRRIVLRTVAVIGHLCATWIQRPHNPIVRPAGPAPAMTACSPTRSSAQNATQRA